MIDITYRGRVAVLKMAHGKANALDIELCEALASQLDDCQQSSSVDALVAIGSGRMFSAGVDLPRVVAGGATYVRAFLPALNGVFRKLFTYPKPVVAAVNGHAIAGGCILACAADARLMARDGGRIGIPELLVGVPFPVVPLEIMRFAVPAPHVQALAFSGRTLTADEALQHGLVDAATDADRLVDEAIAAAQALAALPARAFALTKMQLREPAVQRMAAGAAIDAEAENVWASPDTLAAIDAYVARTFRKAST